MTATALQTVPCTVCGTGEFDLVCPSREIEIQMEYLRRFHRARLKPDAPASALADRAEFTQDYPTDLVSCRECGLLFRNPRPTPDEISRMYAGDEYGPSRLSEMFESQVELYRPKARSLTRWLGQGSIVVEVGSFVGGFLEAGRERGWDVLGVDPGEEVNAFCRERGLPVVEGTLPDASLRAGSVDAVAVWNTFDQIPDPRPTLAEARRILRRGGLLALRVPNGDCFRWGAGWIHRLHRKGYVPSLLLKPILRVMAWNNLLAFPYLHGYSVRTLDGLMGLYGLRRALLRTDSLTRLSDDQTRPWAAREERISKGLIRLAAKVENLLVRDRYRYAPWLDLYYVKV